MIVHAHKDPADFLAQASDFLQEREAENSIILAAVGRLMRHGTGDKPPLLWTVADDSKTVLAAMRTPPHRMVLSGAPSVAIAVFADRLARERVSIPGVVGPLEAVDDFATAWAKLSRQKVHQSRLMRAYELRKAPSRPENVPGTMTRAARADLDVLAQWYREFRTEVRDDMVVDDRKVIEAAIAEERAVVWNDAHPVCMAVCATPTAHGARINTVYTPHALRSRGYATACTASLSQQLLNTGAAFCCLFADLANRTANRIYQRIGYRPISEFGEFRFEA